MLFMNNTAHHKVASPALSGSTQRLFGSPFSLEYSLNRIAEISRVASAGVAAYSSRPRRQNGAGAIAQTPDYVFFDPPTITGDL